MYCGTADAGDDGDDPEVQAAYNTFMNIARSINTEVCAMHVRCAVCMCVCVRVCVRVCRLRAGEP